MDIMVFRTNIIKGENAMSSEAKQTTEEISQEPTQNFLERISKNPVCMILKYIINAIIALTIIVGVIAFVLNMNSNIGSINNRLNSISGGDNNLEMTLSTINNSISNNLDKETFKTFVDNVNAELVSIKEKLNNLMEDNYFDLTDFISCEAENIFVIPDPQTPTSHCPDLKDNDIVATDLNTGEKYSSKSLAGKTVLISYEEDGQEIYFLGKYNKKSHWDGKCTINVYIKDKLYLVTDAEYKDGNLIRYDQVLIDEDILYVSSRKPKGDYNTGTTTTYISQKIKKKKFTRKTVKIIDILTVKKYKKKLKDKNKEGFYSGKTKDGFYNDQTGKAYMVKYSGGTVRTIYVGNFEDGYFNDDTGKAWEIARDKNGSEYVYFKGIFKNSVAQVTNDNKKKLISNDKIHDKIKNMKFKCDVTLYGEKKSKK